MSITTPIVTLVMRAVRAAVGSLTRCPACGERARILKDQEICGSCLDADHFADMELEWQDELDHHLNHGPGAL